MVQPSFGLIYNYTQIALQHEIKNARAENVNDYILYTILILLNTLCHIVLFHLYYTLFVFNSSRNIYRLVRTNLRKLSCNNISIYCSYLYFIMIYVPVVGSSKKCQLCLCQLSPPYDL